MISKIKSFLVCILVLPALALSAQDVGQTIIDNAAVTQYYYTTSQIAGLALKDAAGATSSSKSGRDLTYNPSPRIRSRVIDNLSAKFKLNAAATVKLKQADMNKAFNSIASPYGLSYDDAADIVAAYEVINWMIANQAANPSKTAVLAVRNAAAASLSQNRAIYADAGNRAMLGEELKVLSVILHSGWQAANKNGTSKAFSNAIAAQYKAQFGREMRNLKLDNSGFHP